MVVTASLLVEVSWPQGTIGFEAFPTAFKLNESIPAPLGLIHWQEGHHTDRKNQRRLTPLAAAVCDGPYGRQTCALRPHGIVQ